VFVLENLLSQSVCVWMVPNGTRHNATKHNGLKAKLPVFYSCAECQYADWHHAECLYTKCHHAKCLYGMYYYDGCHLMSFVMMAINIVIVIITSVILRVSLW
jgi:hypothetical protein